MNTTELSDRLKQLLSIRAVLRRAGVSESSFYTSTHREASIPTKNRAKLQRALLDTAADLEAIACELGAGDGERERNTQYDVVRLAACQIERHGVRTRLEMSYALSDAEQSSLRRAFKASFNRRWADDEDMVEGILSMNQGLPGTATDYS